MRFSGRLREGIATRGQIGQAKGILMERYKVTADQAFRMLVTVSNHKNVPLRAVARHLTDTGEWTTHD